MIGCLVMNTEPTTPQVGEEPEPQIESLASSADELSLDDLSQVAGGRRPNLGPSNEDVPL